MVVTVAEVLLASLVVGLGTEHAAYILQYGSLFDSLRKSLRDWACKDEASGLLRWLCAKVVEMIHCQLCCITQLTLWLVVVPASVVVLPTLPYPWWVLAPAVLVAWFAQAAVGLACWDVARLIGRGTDAAVLALRAKQKEIEGRNGGVR